MVAGRFFTCAILLLLALCRLDAQEKVGPVILLDPGHGGIDSGTVSKEGILEKELALYIAKECLRLNSALFNESLNIYLTRYSDTLISLADRIALAESIGADFYLSIRFNHNQVPAIKGFEVYTSINRQNHSFPFEKQSKLLAQQLLIGFYHKLGSRGPEPKPANFQVLRETSGLCPSVLLEVGYLSNESEARHYKKASSGTAVALVILEAILTLTDDEQSL